MERIITKTQALVVSAALAIGMAGPASAGVNDPEVIIYRFPGVFDSGGSPLIGIATSFSCTNFSGATENIRIVSRRADLAIMNNTVISIQHLGTLSTATHASAYGSFSGSLAVSNTFIGTTAIAATSINIICTAMTIDASSVVPVGVSLRGIRFNPAPGSQE